MLSWLTVERCCYRFVMAHEVNNGASTCGGFMAHESKTVRDFQDLTDEELQLLLDADAEAPIPLTRQAAVPLRRDRYQTMGNVPELETAPAENEELPPQPTLRSCRTCQAMFEWDGRPFITLCLDCYKTQARPCATCDRNLPINAKKWTKICTECWINKRAKTHGPCPLCPPEKREHLRKRFDQPACDDCMKNDARRKFFLKRPHGLVESSPLMMKGKSMSPIAREMLIRKVQNRLSSIHSGEPVKKLNAENPNETPAA